MSWQELAACVGYPTSLFFPDHGNGASAAKQICSSCPVIAECREAGQHVAYGVWGGLTEAERFGDPKPRTQRLLPCRICRTDVLTATRGSVVHCDGCRRLVKALRYRVGKLAS